MAGTEGGHHSSEELAAYLSDGLAPEARTAFDAHIAECRECRTETASARRLLISGRPRKWIWVAPVATAAAVVLITLFSTTPPDRGTEELTRTSTGGASAGGVPRLAVITPADGAVLSGSGMFSWHAHEPNALYRVRVSDGSGTLLWSAETPDTSAFLPANVLLDANRQYLWSVDAIGPDGTSATTGAYRFTTPP